ncbi:hypothetical protein [Phyllobacterium sp. 22552]|uniref:hypothetical protein n=1 Tax=Phyllobacterium sp. 22552 TaxID=3453941 RepID=UPI003F8605A7
MSKRIIDKLYAAVRPLLNEHVTPRELRDTITYAVEGKPTEWKDQSAENKALLQKGIRGKPLFEE